MIEKLGVTEEEARACVFFMLTWRYVGDGPAMRDKAILLLPPDRLGEVPEHIIENLERRLNRSIQGDQPYEWIDRAVPGYSATIRAMRERKFGIVDKEPPSPAVAEFIKKLRGELECPD